MFSKVEKNYIYIKSSMHEIPEEIGAGNNELAENLLSLVKLIGEKYRLDDVQARFDNVTSNTVSIVLFNGLNGPNNQEIDKENTKPIEYLKSFGAKVEKEPYKVDKYPYWSNSIVTVDRSQINGLVEGLKLLTAPSEPAEPRMMARC